jgi:hypothetical protein
MDRGQSEASSMAKKTSRPAPGSAASRRKASINKSSGKSPGKTSSRQQSTKPAARPSATAQAGSSAARQGFAFGNPKVTADDFAAFTTNEIQADSALKASDQPSSIGSPWICHITRSATIDHAQGHDSAGDLERDLTGLLLTERCLLHGRYALRT